MTYLEDDDLIAALARLGDGIDDATDRTGGTDIAEAVRASVTTSSPTSLRWWAVAASVAAVTIIAVAAVPDSRHAVARWFGVDGVDVEIEPGLSLPPPVSAQELVGPGDSTVVAVAGREILVSAIAGAFDDQLITKRVAGSEQLTEIEVNGAPGLWIGGSAHEVLYVLPGSEIVVERVAARTLLWNEGDVLYRVEGFDRLDDALEFARGGVSTTADE